MIKINQNVLKIIAIIAMTLDHIAYAFIPYESILYIIFRLIGRITFPILIYCVVEGYKNTKSIKNYALRLFIFALISQVPYTLLFNTTQLNPIFSMFLALAFLIIFNLKINRIIKIVLIVFILYISTYSSYEIFTIILVYLFYITYKNKKYTNIAYSSFIVIELFITYFSYDLKTTIIKLGLFLPIFLINIYSNERINSSVFKYFIYIYYPIHLIIIYIFCKLL